MVVKGDLAAHQNVKHDTEAPHIDFRPSIGPGLEELGRCEVETSAEGFEMAARSKKVAESEVDDLDISRLTDEDVLDLEISVDDAVPMAVVKGARYLAAELPGLLLLELAVGDDVVEHLAAVDIFKEHVPMVIGSYDIAQATNVWVVKECNDGRLPRRADFLRLVGPLLVCS